MGRNISNKPPANSLPSECPVARKGRFHQPLADKETALCSVVCYRNPCGTSAQTETLGNYPSAHHLRASAAVHVLVRAAFEQLPVKGHQSLPTNKGFPGSPVIQPESSWQKGVYILGHSQNVKAPGQITRIARHACVPGTGWTLQNRILAL